MPIDFVQASEDVECGTLRLDAHVRNLVAQDADQFLVMTKLIGNSRCLRRYGVKLTCGDRVRPFARQGDCLCRGDRGSLHDQSGGTPREKEQDTVEGRTSDKCSARGNPCQRNRARERYPHHTKQLFDDDGDNKGYGRPNDKSAMRKCLRKGWPNGIHAPGTTCLIT
jgi:hypothetical protein